MLYQPSTLNCNGTILSLEEPVVMGIINVTPDSFYEGSRFEGKTAVLKQTEKLLEEGAVLIDIGGMSSRPGAKVIDVAEECQRVLPVIKAVKQTFPEAILSIDTVHAEVANACVSEGAGMINDISAGTLDEDMFRSVAALNVPYVLMHMLDRPATMQDEPVYEDVVLEIVDFFIREVGKLRSLNVKDIIIDPGFGFGKTVRHNYQLLQQLDAFSILGLPLLVGLSRKSMIYKPLATTPELALNGTTALHMLALNNGAKILRVHDVQPAIEVIKLYLQLKNSEQS